ncbi:hypothetical protein FQN60_001997 [Etheostoma spectabile]|uniref:Uncharacterized protein n=1 Tax=Etheostoma spectabile TaxID=54343 RepID=A0A5J5DBQ3_9PERO|nr:hypothetical protein FQN60_001997 [Etheostoma spectabile]
MIPGSSFGEGTRDPLLGKIVNVYMAVHETVVAVQFVEVGTLEPVCPQSQKVCPEEYSLKVTENWVGYGSRSRLRWGEAACCELEANTQGKQEDDGKIYCHQHETRTTAIKSAISSGSSPRELNFSLNSNIASSREPMPKACRVDRGDHQLERLFIDPLLPSASSSPRSTAVSYVSHSFHLLGNAEYTGGWR